MLPRETPIFWIELWHGVLVLALLALLVPLEILEPWGLLLGGLFMGVNFFLLSYGVRLALSPLAGQGRVRMGVCLLTLKMILLLGLISFLFVGVPLDALSFAAGVSSLLVAVVLQGSWSHYAHREVAG
jgi:hypothetical protein